MGHRHHAPGGPMTGNPGGPMKLAEDRLQRSHAHGRQQLGQRALAWSRLRPRPHDVRLPPARRCTPIALRPEAHPVADVRLEIIPHYPSEFEGFWIPARFMESGNPLPGCVAPATRVISSVDEDRV